MIVSKELNQSLFREFIDAVNESIFLFNQDLYDRLELYYKIALHFESNRSFKVAEIVEPIPDWMSNTLIGYGPDNLREFSDLQAKVTLYFKDEFFKQKGYFKEYLDFRRMK